jgi:DNA modification methylase
MKTVIETRQINSLKLWDKNPRSIKENRFNELKKSITELGFNDVLKITEDGTVIGGNMRLRALQDLGWAEVPVVVTTAKTDAEILRIALRDNEEFGYYEEEQVAELALAYLDPLELETFELHLGKPTKLNLLTDKFGPEIEEDEPPEVDESNVVSKLGEIYQLGKHRLMCGDSTDTSQVAELMDGIKADMVFTDPPYGVSYQSNMRTKSEKFDVIENDDNIDELGVVSAFAYSEKWVLVCTSWKVLKQWLDVLSPIADPQNIIIWDKGGGGIGDLEHSLATDYEVILAYNRGAEIVGKRIGSVWSVGKDGSSSYLHPTQKPVALPAMAFKTFTNTGAIVLDAYLGSGSTLIACEQTDRICYGMELDPKYCDVIRKRYSKLIDEDNWEETWQSLTPVARP